MICPRQLKKVHWKSETNSVQEKYAVQDKIQSEKISENFFPTNFFPNNLFVLTIFFSN